MSPPQPNAYLQSLIHKARNAQFRTLLLALEVECELEKALQGRIEAKIRSIKKLGDEILRMQKEMTEFQKSTEQEPKTFKALELMTSALRVQEGQVSANLLKTIQGKLQAVKLAQPQLGQLLLLSGYCDFGVTSEFTGEGNPFTETPDSEKGHVGDVENVDVAGNREMDDEIDWVGIGEPGSGELEASDGRLMSYE